LTAGQFFTKATGALFLWPKELLDTELSRKALAYTQRHDLFAGNPDFASNASNSGVARSGTNSVIGLYGTSK
jgi:hypothetical protein